MSKGVSESAKVSLVGTRSLNQDRCTILETSDTMLLALADGMGGHPKGEEAAQILIDTCTKSFFDAIKPIPDPGLFLKHLLHLAHIRIVRFGQSQSPAIAPRTTAVMALIQQGQVCWSHVGDSRCYHFRNNRLLARTVDHSYVERLRSRGIISGGECNTHPYRNYVTRCLGGAARPPEVESGEPSPLWPGDILLLCSDGFWGPLGSKEIKNSLDSETPLNEAISRLAYQAGNTAFPDSDNVTAVACRWLGQSPSAEGKTMPTAEDEHVRLEQAISELQQAFADYEDERKQEY